MPLFKASSATLSLGRDIGLNWEIRQFYVFPRDFRIVLLARFSSLWSLPMVWLARQTSSIARLRATAAAAWPGAAAAVFLAGKTARRKRWLFIVIYKSVMGWHVHFLFCCSTYTRLWLIRVTVIKTHNEITWLHFSANKRWKFKQIQRELINAGCTIYTSV